MSIVNDILKITDDILSIRDDIGAIKSPVYILTRKWQEAKGIGLFSDKIEQVLPTPYLVDLSHSLRLREGGNIKQGDIIVKMISKQSYPNESDINASVNDDKTERWYLINDCTYDVISVTQEYVYWNVQLRKTVKNKYGSSKS